MEALFCSSFIIISDFLSFSFGSFVGFTLLSRLSIPQAFDSIVSSSGGSPSSTAFSLKFIGERLKFQTSSVLHKIITVFNSLKYKLLA